MDAPFLVSRCLFTTRGLDHIHVRAPGRAARAHAGARRSHVPRRSRAPARRRRAAVRAASRTTDRRLARRARRRRSCAVVVVPLFAQVRLPPPSRPIAAYVTAAGVRGGARAAPPGRARTRVASGPPRPGSCRQPTTAAAPVVGADERLAAGERAAPCRPGGGRGWRSRASALGASGIGLPGPPALTLRRPRPPPAVRVVRVGGDVRAPQQAAARGARLSADCRAGAHLRHGDPRSDHLTDRATVVDVRVLRVGAAARRRRRRRRCGNGGTTRRC